jgi:taurine dioxygenase
MTEPTIKVDRISPVIGAEVSGVDLSQSLPEATIRAIDEALLTHLVVFFRDQDITIEQHKAFGQRFGELHVHPAAPKLQGDPAVMVIHSDAVAKYVAGDRWHSDVSCDLEPPMGSLLRLIQVPSSGGDTLFASMYAAYEGLSDRMQHFLSGLTGVHEGEQLYRGRYESKEQLRDAGYPVAEHPVIRTHPITGRNALYVNEAFTTRIKELAPTESAAVLGLLFKQAAAPEFQCRFRWRTHSIAFWDNRCTQHHAVWDYWPETRRGYRVTIKGDRPFYRPATAASDRAFAESAIFIDQERTIWPDRRQD